MKEDHENWNQLAGALRKAGAVEPPGDSSPPLGFSTRVLAEVRTNARADHVGLVLWRRWALGAAAASCFGCGLLFVALPEPESQFLPVPALDFPTPAP